MPVYPLTLASLVPQLMPKFLPFHHAEYRQWRLGSAFHLASSLSLVTLMVCSTYSYPTIHTTAAILFFLLSLIAMCLATKSIKSLAAANPIYRKSARLKAAILAIFTSAFILYIPIGLSLVTGSCAWYRLPLDSDYCYANPTVCDEYKLNDTETVFWDYGNCPGVNTMRAVSQLVCVVCVGLFIGSYYFENDSLVENGETGSYRVHKGFVKGKQESYKAMDDDTGAQRPAAAV